MKPSVGTLCLCAMLMIMFATMAQSSTKEESWIAEIVILRAEVNELHVKLAQVERRLDEQGQPMLIGTPAQPQTGSMQSIYPTLPPKTRDGEIINGFGYDYKLMKIPQSADEPKVMVPPVRP